MYALVGIWIAIGLLVIGALAMLVSGIRGVINGSVGFMKMGMFLVPIIAFIISYLIIQNIAKAAIITMFFMLAVMVLGIIITGSRSTFNL